MDLEKGGFEGASVKISLAFAFCFPSYHLVVISSMIRYVSILRESRKIARLKA